MSAPKALWPHQELALKLAGREFAQKAEAVCIVMPTGAGKTKTAGAAIVRHLIKNPDGLVVWHAHREELVSQAYDDLTEFWGLSCGVIQSSPTRTVNPHRPVQIISTQTALARGLILPGATLGILDEAHHYASDKWIELALQYRRQKTRLIGLTATPVRGDARGFEGFMDALVCPVTMKELIRDGFLTGFRPDQHLIAPPHKLRSDQIAQRPVDAYLEHARGRKAMVFAGHVKAMREYCDQFTAAGIVSDVVWGTMDAGLRRRTLDAFKVGKIQVLCNVGVLTEGFDDPTVSCAILARSIGSLSLYLQICGRALRRCDGKDDAIIIDLHGNCRDPEFGSPDDDREWTLEGDGVKHKVLERPSERFCKVCGQLVLDDTALVCSDCGIKRPELLVPDIANIKLVKYAAKLREPENVRKAYFEKLVAQARSNGYSQWQPHMKYKALYGEKPPRAWWS